MTPTWEMVIGLEVHAQLKTKTKLFCRCENVFGREGNTLTCPVCLGMPGGLPDLNGQAVNYAIPRRSFTSVMAVHPLPASAK